MMKDRTYRYSGPNSAVTLVVTDPGGVPVERDVMLWSGRDVVLPEGHPYTQALLGQQLIAPVPAEKAAPVSPPAPAASPAATRKPAAPVPAPAATH
ncbi:hypothetical protein ACT2FY_44910 [Paraburkholderia fungorum]|uniref:hypothetical protein n=2 Tax=Paraburkholderia fungorum TaxID=134537 RepID=UPI00402B1B06